MENYSEVTKDFMLHLMYQTINGKTEKDILYNHYIINKILLDFSTGLKIMVSSNPILLCLTNEDAEILCSGTSLDFILGYLNRISEENEFAKESERKKIECKIKKREKKSKLKLK